MIDFEVNIPDEDFSEFIELINLEELDFDDLVSKTEKIKISLYVSDIRKELESITKFNKIILGLYYAFCKLDISGTEFIDKLYKFYISKVEKPYTIEEFKGKVNKLFHEKNPIRISIKSAILRWENKCIYDDSRIISDIRPVFNNRNEEEIISNIILHQLRIDYREDNDVEKEIFITLNENNLIDLKEVVDRALRKNEILKQIKLNK